MGKRLKFHYTGSQMSMQLLLIAILGIVAALMQLESADLFWAGLTQRYSSWALLIAGPWIIHKFLFWPISLFFLYVDKHNKPQFIAKYRIQQGAPKRPSMPQTLKVLAWNQIFWAPLMLILMAWMLKLRGWEVEAQFPSWGQISMELVGLGAISAVIFYATHRFLHRPWWMKKVHRVHHEYKTTTSIASEYAHPVEFCIGNFGTLAGGVVLIAPTLFSIYLFTVLSIVTILIHHCGYALPWAPWSIPHDWHHYKYKEVFGTVGVMDRIFGTDQDFKKLQHDELY